MVEIADNSFYSIKVDKEKNRIYLTVLGFWQKAGEVPEYLNDMEKAVKLVTAGFTVLADLKKMKVPAQEVGAVHVKAQNIVVQAGLSKTAEVHPESMLAKLSVDRFSEESGMKKGLFPSVEEAELWLDAR